MARPAQPPTSSSISLKATVFISVFALCLSWVGFVAGLNSVAEPPIQTSAAALRSEGAPVPVRKPLSEAADLSKVTIRNIATVPFSQL
ncbi:MAG: hypothetical protein ABI992_13820, partial [Chthoniobacterales bacterium]